jgi:uncharacterized membrane protein YeaQ/YmgE (transglycosylase-associated protein family)
MWWLLYELLIGLVCGFLGAKIMGSKSSLVKDLILGVVGSMVGGLIAKLLGLTASNLIGSILIGAAGACLVIWLVNKYAK